MDKRIKEKLIKLQETIFDLNTQAKTLNDKVRTTAFERILNLDAVLKASYEYVFLDGKWEENKEALVQHLGEYDDDLDFNNEYRLQSIGTHAIHTVIYNGKKTVKSNAVYMSSNRPIDTRGLTVKIKNKLFNYIPLDVFTTVDDLHELLQEDNIDFETFDKEMDELISAVASVKDDFISIARNENARLEKAHNEAVESIKNEITEAFTFIKKNQSQIDEANLLIDKYDKQFQEKRNEVSTNILALLKAFAETSFHPDDCIEMVIDYFDEEELLFLTENNGIYMEEYDGNVQELLKYNTDLVVSALTEIIDNTEDGHLVVAGSNYDTLYALPSGVYNSWPDDGIMSLTELASHNFNINDVGEAYYILAYSGIANDASQDFDMFDAESFRSYVEFGDSSQDNARLLYKSYGVSDEFFEEIKERFDILMDNLEVSNNAIMELINTDIKVIKDFRDKLIK